MYKPLSSENLLKRGSCCNNNCINCPYKENKTMNNKQFDTIVELLGKILIQLKRNKK